MSGKKKPAPRESREAWQQRNAAEYNRVAAAIRRDPVFASFWNGAAAPVVVLTCSNGHALVHVRLVLDNDGKPYLDTADGLRYSATPHAGRAATNAEPWPGLLAWRCRVPDCRQRARMAAFVCEDHREYAPTFLGERTQLACAGTIATGAGTEPCPFDGRYRHAALLERYVLAVRQRRAEVRLQ